MDQTLKKDLNLDDVNNSQNYNTMVHIIQKSKNNEVHINPQNVEINSRLRMENTNSQSRRRTTVMHNEMMERERKQQSAIGPRDSVSLV